MREIDTIDISYKTINRDILKGWVAFYWIDNELVRYSSETHDWVDLPKIGVQFLFRIYNNYKEQVGGCDFYCPYQLMNSNDVNSFIKFGLYLDDDIFNNIVWPIIRDDEINK